MNLECWKFCGSACGRNALKEILAGRHFWHFESKSSVAQVNTLCDVNERDGATSYAGFLGERDVMG